MIIYDDHANTTASPASFYSYNYHSPPPSPSLNISTKRHRYIFGGRSSTDTYDDLFYIELSSTMTWVRIPASTDGQVTRYGAFMAFNGNTLTVFGGKDTHTGSLISDMYQVDLGPALSDVCGCDKCTDGYTTGGSGSSNSSECSLCDRGYGGAVPRAH